MTLKLAQFCDDPQKISTKSSYPQKIFIFLNTPKNIKIQNFEPQKIAWAYVCAKISEYPPWGCNHMQIDVDLSGKQKHMSKTAHAHAVQSDADS